MKKLLFIFILLLSISACHSEPPKYLELETYNVDMSLYRKMSSHDHRFIGTSVEEFNRVFKEKGSGIFFLGSHHCANCQKICYLVNEAAVEADVKIYYIELENGIYNPKHPAIVELTALLKEQLNTDEEGEAAIYMPHVLVLKNGKIIGSEIGIPDAGKNDFVEYLIAAYSKMFAKLK